MTEDEILDERALLYASAEQANRVASRCLRVALGAREWLFPEGEIRSLLSESAVCALPPGVRWSGYHCVGLLSHAMTPIPVLCWGELAGYRALDSAQETALLLLLAGAGLALRVPAPVEMRLRPLGELGPDDHPWSLGRTAGGESVADLARLVRGEG